MGHCGVAFFCLIGTVGVSSRNVTKCLVASALKVLHVVLSDKAVSLLLFGGAEQGLNVESRAIAGEGEEDEHSGNDENARRVSHG